MIIDKKKYHKEYYQKNRDLLLERFKQKILCPTCNRKLCILSYKRHLKSLYHKKRIHNINHDEPPKQYISKKSKTLKLAQQSLEKVRNDNKKNNNFNKVDNITVSF